jgi:hypothetical protein
MASASGSGSAVAPVVASASGSGSAVISGTVRAAGRPLPGSVVALYGAQSSRSVRLGRAVSGSRGGFRIRYPRRYAGGVLYVLAVGGRRPGGRAITLMSVAGSPGRSRRVVAINELTTVAGGYALDQIAHGNQFYGRGPGPRNSAATVANLVNPGTGRPGAVVSSPPNGSDTSTLATMRTLADLVAACVKGGPSRCHALFAAARPPRGPAPHNTLAAVLDIARNPAHNAGRLFKLATARAYRGQLGTAPSAWVLSLIYTEGGFDGPGRMAFDSHGNSFTTNNFEPPGTDAGLGLISLSPTGSPINGSPVTGGGLQGAWWGIAVDSHNNTWVSNFVGADTTPFYSPDFIGGDSVAEFTDQGVPLSPASGFTQGHISGPQGMAVDQRGNVWIANHVGSSMTEYLGGDPNNYRVFTGNGISKPFAIAVDAQGNKWITDNAISSLPGGVTEITAAGQVMPVIEGGGLSSPQGIATDQWGNKWVANFGTNSVTEISPSGAIYSRSPLKASSFLAPWGVAVDGDGRVFVASFLAQTLTELCGARTRSCPPGAASGAVLSPPRRGFTNGGLQHLTAVQIDPSGDVWVANNWSKVSPITGGNGLVEFIGLAAPVKTPLIGAPQSP